MSMSNYKKALSILNQIDLKDSKTTFRLLYRIAENNPSAIIKAENLANPKDGAVTSCDHIVWDRNEFIETLNEKIAINACKNKVSSFNAIVKEIGQKTGLSSLESFNLVNKYFQNV